MGVASSRHTLEHWVGGSTHCVQHVAAARGSCVHPSVPVRLSAFHMMRCAHAAMVMGYIQRWRCDGDATAMYVCLSVCRTGKPVGQSVGQGWFLVGRSVCQGRPVRLSGRNKGQDTRADRPGDGRASGWMGRPVMNPDGQTERPVISPGGQAHRPMISLNGQTDT